MGKDLKGKELGKGMRQRKDGTYEARFVNRFGTRKYVYSSTEKGIKQKFDDALFEDRSKKNVVDDSLTLDDWHKRKAISERIQRDNMNIYIMLTFHHILVK